MAKANIICQTIITWHNHYGRHNLPWQQQRNPYRVWVSEVMLQQTQVTTVIPYFKRFMDRFSDIDSLACATIDEVLFLWIGLGYYSRARNLHRCARQLVKHHQGKLPNSLTELQKLPGIGRTTAAAILALSRGQRQAILDANVKRVLSRLYAIQQPISQTATIKRLWQLSEQLTEQIPSKQVINYTQGIMDLGATLCLSKTPKCDTCPLTNQCVAYQQNQQYQLPISNPTRLKPLRSTTFVWAQYDDHLLLYKRPDKGIWAGLWCLPTEDDFNRIDWPEVYYADQSCYTFKHTFSHFQLQASAKIYWFNSLFRLSSGWLWYNKSSAYEIGLPQPIVKLIGHHLNQTVSLGKVAENTTSMQLK